MPFKNILSSALAAICFSACSFSKKQPEAQAKKVEIIETSQYVFMRMPANEFSRADVQTSVGIAVDHIQKGLNNILDSKSDLSVKIKMLSDNRQRVADIVLQAGHVIDGKKDGIEGFVLSSLMPSAYMIFIGGKMSGNAGLGAGYAGGIGIIIVPQKIIRIDKLTQRRSEYFNVLASVAAFPMTGSFGVGAGGGAGASIGAGAIWGELSSPRDFKGVYVGPAAGFGLGPVSGSGHLGFLMRTGNGLIDNVFFLVNWEPGARLELKVHGEIGLVADSSTILQSMGLSASGANIHVTEQTK